MSYTLNISHAIDKNIITNTVFHLRSVQYNEVPQTIQIPHNYNKF